MLDIIFAIRYLTFEIETKATRNAVLLPAVYRKRNRAAIRLLRVDLVGVLLALSLGYKH